MIVFIFNEFFVFDEVIPHDKKIVKILMISTWIRDTGLPTKKNASSLATTRALVSWIDLVTVFDAILTNRQTREKLQCLYQNLMSNNFRKTAVLEKYEL